MKYSFIIIDATNLFWRCFTVALKNCIFNLKEEIFASAIEEFFSRIEKFREYYANKNTKFYFLFDNPNSTINFRKEIDETYKNIRSKKEAPIGLYKTMERAIQILKCYSNNFYIITLDGSEADDITYPLLQKIKKEETLNDFSRCLCISNDVDWSRNISEYVDWFNFKEIYNTYNFKTTFGFTCEAEKIKLWKAIHGDNSDEIKNAVPYLPKQLLLEILEKYKNVDEMFKDLEQKFKEERCSKWELKILDAKEQIQKNYLLVDFIYLNIEISSYIISCSFDAYQLNYWKDLLNIKFKTLIDLEIKTPETYFSC